MFEAKDILFIVLAFCALWFTAFMCWFVFQIAVVIKSVNDLLGEMKHQVGRLEQSLNGIKARFEHNTAHLSKMTDHMKDVAAGWKDNAMKKMDDWKK